VTYEEEYRQYTLWLGFSEQERLLRTVMAEIEYEDAVHSRCVAEKNAHRPLHVTQLWEDTPYGFALKLEGCFQSTWVVKLEPDGEIFDVMLVNYCPEVPSRSVLYRTNRGGDEELRARWIGAFRAFLHQRGLMREAPTT
jgi:hypothetical protein